MDKFKVCNNVAHNLNHCKINDYILCSKCNDISIISEQIISTRKGNLVKKEGIGYKQNLLLNVLV